MDFDEINDILEGKVYAAEAEDDVLSSPPPPTEAPEYTPPEWEAHPDFEGVEFRAVKAWCLFPLSHRWMDVDLDIVQYRGFAGNCPLDVPSVPPVYFPNEDVLVALCKSDYLDLQTLLVGHTGTGKTSVLEYFAAMTGRPFVRFNFDATTDDQKLFGSLELKDGETYFNKSDITKSLDYPAVVCLDEFSRANSFQTMLVNPLLDNKMVRVTSHDDKLSETSVAVEGWRVFGTDNTNGTGDDMDLYNSANVLDEAIRNRFDIFQTVPYLSESEERHLIQALWTKRTGDEMDNDSVRKLAKVSSLLHKGYEDRTITTAFSARNLQAVLALHSIGDSLPQAIKTNFLSRASTSDQPDITETIRTVFGE